MMALYLCKMDPNNTLPNGEPRLIGVVGRIVGNGGFRFLPHVAGRKPSRKAWANALDCIPNWAHQQGYTRLLDEHEMATARAAFAKEK